MVRGSNANGMAGFTAFSAAAVAAAAPTVSGRRTGCLVPRAFTEVAAKAAAKSQKGAMSGPCDGGFAGLRAGFHRLSVTFALSCLQRHPGKIVAASGIHDAECGGDSRTHAAACVMTCQPHVGGRRGCSISWPE
jgi:hypothetical protein